MADTTLSPRPHLSPTTVVGYARSSSDLQTASVGDQRQAIERWATTQGCPLAAVFTDDGVSGGKLSRPGLDALLAHVEAHPRGGVVVMWDVARLARPDDPLDGMLLERRITRAGWRVVFLHDAARTGDPLTDRLMGLMGFHHAGQYRRTLALSTTRGAASSMAAGASWRGPTPYGYAKRVTWADGRVQVVPRGMKVPTRDAREVRLVPGDPREVDAARSIFDDYARGGLGFPGIVARLVASGAPAPGARWNVSTVRELLANPVYTGDLVWNRKTYGRLVAYAEGAPHLLGDGERRVRRNARADWVVVREAHEALVDRATFERVQAIRGERGRARGGARRAERYPLSGLLACGACGGPMVMKNCHRYKAGRKLDARQARYRCAGPDPSRGCAGFSIHEDVIEAAVRAALHEALGRYRTSARLRAAIVRELEADRPAGAGARDALAAEERDLTARIARTVALLPDVDPDTARDLAAKVKGWRGRLAEVQAERERAARSAPPAVDVEALADGIAGTFDRLKTLPAGGRAVRREFYAEALDRVTVRPKADRAGARTRYVPVGGEVVVRAPLAMACAGASGREGLVDVASTCPPTPRAPGRRPGRRCGP